MKTRGDAWHIREDPMADGCDAQVLGGDEKASTPSKSARLG